MEREISRIIYVVRIEIYIIRRENETSSSTISHLETNADVLR